MRLCIPIPFKPEGGGQYFLQLFGRHLSTHGHEVVDDVEGRYDVLFTNHWVVVLSKDPKEFERDVTMIREVESALGSYEIKLSEGIAERKKWSRHLVANLDATTG